jgi:hypothetical protein
MDELKRTTVGAVLSSFLLVMFLLLFVHNQVRQGETEVDRLVMSLFILLQTYVVVHLWVRCAKKYIDRAIDRKLAAGVENKETRTDAPVF